MAEPAIGIEEARTVFSEVVPTSPEPSPHERFAVLAEAVRSTEASLAAGPRQVDARITDEALRLVYERRLSLALPPLPFRGPTIETLLERAGELWEPRRLIVPARAEVTEKRHDDEVRVGLRVTTGEGAEAVSWSVPRIFDVRFWGINIRPDDDAGRVVLQERLWEQLLSKLASDFSSITRIEERFAGRPAAELVLIPDRDGEAFERLCVDILNEGPLRARLAPLAEDFLEKTDLRVMIPGLDRKRGARVQVTTTQNGAWVHTKRNAIRAAAEFVHLSPWTLAEALAGARATDLLSAEEAHAVYQVLGQTGGSPEVVARALRSVFVFAIRNPGRDPRGPVVRVAPAVRRLVQAFVAREGKSATGALREREARREGGR